MGDETEKNICAAVMMEMTTADDSQEQMTMCSSSMSETATMDRMTKFEDRSFMKMTRASRQTPTK